MRVMFTIACLIAAALQFSSLADAQGVAALSNRTTTHDIANCQIETDLPVCILRALAKFPTHSPYWTDWHFVGASAVLAEVGDNIPPTQSQRFPKVPDALLRYLYGELEDDDAAAAVTILADRLGASPADAVAIIRETRNPFHACQSYQEVWEAFGSASERAERPATPRPSEALARAAIRACEDTNLDPRQMDPRTLAAAYAKFDDHDGVTRSMRRSPQSPRLAQLETAVLNGDIDAAVRLSDTSTVSIQSNERQRFAALRVQVIRAAAAEGRADLVRSLATRSLSDISAADASFMDALSPSVDALLQLDRTFARTYLESLDHYARTESSVASLTASVAAARGWVAFGETQRAQALVDLWSPRIEPAGSSCGGSYPFCVGSSVAEMLTEMGRAEESWTVAPGVGAMTRIGADFRRGRGLQHLETHLAHMASPHAYDDALGDCVLLANYSPEQLAWAEACTRRLLDRLNQPLPMIEERRRLALLSTLKVAALAARQGEVARTEEMLRASLNVANGSGNIPLDVRERQYLLEIAIFQLEAARRL